MVRFFRKSVSVLGAILLIFSLCCSVACGAENGKRNEKPYTGAEYGLGAYQSIDHLAKLKSDIFYEQQSSYSRGGGNADGFGLVLPDGSNQSGEIFGTESSVKRVLLDLQSPGIIYRMWFTNFGPVPNLRIYIDGKKVVDMGLSELCNGENYPFVQPFVQDKESSSGGFVCYLPIAFAKSVKVIGSGDFYYNIDYHVYPSDSEITSFTMDIDVEDCKNILSDLSQDPKFTGDNTYRDELFSLNGSETKTIEVDGKKSISSVKMRIPSVKTEVYDRTIYDDRGVKLVGGGKISFNMDIDSGARLYVRTALLKDEQFADVFVDGKNIGQLRARPRRIDGLEWKDNDYFEDISIALPKSVANGKKTVKTEIVGLNHFAVYKVWIQAGGESTDSLDIGNEKEEQAHKYRKQGTALDSRLSAEYDPNGLIGQKRQKELFRDEDFLNNVYIRITFDGKSEANVEAPISSFFGFGNFGAYETVSLMTGLTADGWMYCYYPMPFENHCKIEIINRNQTPMQDVELNLGYKDFEGTMSEYGYFSTQYTERINGTASQLHPNQYYDILKTEGSGHFVGITLSATGNYFGGNTRYYLEGDEVGYIDGSRSHSLHGTGTEDFFNGGWYFNNGTQVNALYGNPVHNYRNNMDRTVMIRSFVGDFIPFRDGIHLMLEHGGLNNRTDSNIYALAYYYSNDQAKSVSTDRFSIEDESAARHGYTVTDSTTKEIRCGLEALYKDITAIKPFNHIKGSSQFKVKIDAENNGVILRRLMNADILEQSAQVYVDGEAVGIWNERQRAALGFMRYENFLIPKKFTEGKSEITVKIVNQNENGEGIEWTENSYEIFTLKK